MKRFYVTKKQVMNYIDEVTKTRGIDQDELLNEVRFTLTELIEYPTDNKAQIKFFEKVESALCGYPVDYTLDSLLRV
jgi:hypothetical protein